MENLMYLAEIAEKYYLSACPSYTQNGFEKNVLMDTETKKCIFVSGDVEPKENELLFRCKRSRGETIITQKSIHRKKTEEKEKWSRRFEGIVRSCRYDNENKDDFVYPPEKFTYEKMLAVKLSNLDYYLHHAMSVSNGGDRYVTPCEGLCRLEEKVLNPAHGLPYETYLIPYRKDEECGGDYIFHFSHFEKFEEGLCVVYEYNGTCS